MPLPRQNLSDGHGAQTAWAGLSWYVPGAQSEGVVDARGQLEPLGQVMQAAGEAP